MKNSISLSFRGATGDEESRSALRLLRARFLAEFTLSGRARSFAALRMTSEGLGMTALRDFFRSLVKASSQPTEWLPKGVPLIGKANNMNVLGLVARSLH